MLSRRRIARYAADRLIDGKVSGLAQSMAGYLIDARQQHQLKYLILDIERELAIRGKHLVADITAARSLGADLERDMIAFLRSDSGIESVEARHEVDPSLIGGVIVQTPIANYDKSIASRLRRLRALRQTKGA